MPEAAARGPAPATAGARPDAAAPQAAARTAAPTPQQTVTPAKSADLTAARAVVRRLAPHLGLEPDSVPLRITDARHTNSLGAARAAADADGLLLRPSELTDPDPALFAHELTHLAQHRNRSVFTQTTDPTLSHASARPSVSAAEAEAAALADAVRYGTPLWRPRALLPSGHLARDVDATGVLAARPANPVPGTAPATSTGNQPGSTTNPAEQKGPVPGTASELQSLVVQNHKGEIDRIRAELGDFWHLNSDKRDYILSVLDPVPFLVGRAMISALDSDQRQRLALFSDEQHQAHPAAAVAVLAALDTTDIDALGENLTKGKHSPLYGLAADRLTGSALRAVYSILRNLGQNGLDQLFATDRRQFFADLLATPPPVGSDQADLTAVVVVERRLGEVYSYSMGGTGSAGNGPAGAAQPGQNQGVDAALVVQVAKILTDHGADSARSALAALAPLAKASRAGHPGKAATAAAVATGTAQAAADAANAPAGAGERLHAVVDDLDRRGLIDVILDNLPADDRYTVKPPVPYGDILAAVLSARAPGLSLPRIESLLSYGIFDWVITDEEALFANLLVHSLPPTVQDEWRHRDEGKWLHRLEDNLPEVLLTGGSYTGVGSEFTVAGAEGANDPDTMALFNWVLGEWKSDKLLKAFNIIDRLAGVTYTDSNLKAPTTQAATGAVRRLDALGTLSDILEKAAHLYTGFAAGRQEIDKVASMRDPILNERHALHLLGRNIFYILTARDAWLAHLLLRAMPPEEQDRFDKAHPGLWSEMESALTPEMIRSDANQALTGRDGFPPREDLRNRLRDEKLWDKAHLMQLRAVIDLANASDDREFVFDQSRLFHAYRRPGFAKFVDEFELYKPPLREHSPEPFVRSPRLDEEIGSLILEGMRMVVFAAGPFLELVSSSFGHTMHLDVDLNKLQWAMGGDVRGAEFTERPDEDDEWADPTNRIRIDLDTGTGAFRIHLPELKLDRLNISRPGTSYRTGAVHLQGLEIAGDISDTHYREPIGVEVAMTGADVQDVVIADSSFPGGAVALADVFLKNLEFKAGKTGDEDLKAHPPRSGTIPIPVFGPLLQALENITALWGGIPGDFTLLDFMLMPVTSGMSFLGGEAVEHAADLAFPTPSPGDYLYGYFSDGTPRPPRSVSERGKDAMRMLRSMQLSFSKLTFSGVSLGAGTQIADVSLKDVSIGIGRSTPTYLRAQINSLDRRIKLLTGPEKDAAQAERGRLWVKLVGLLDDEDRQGKLESTDRWINGSLTEEERTGHKEHPKGSAKSAAEQAADAPSMAELNREQRADAGVVIDVGSLEVGETSGRFQIAGARLGQVHLEARLPAEAVPFLNGGYLDDKTLIENFLKGDGPQARTRQQYAAASEVKFSVASAGLLPAPDGGPALQIDDGKGGTWSVQTVSTGPITAGIDSVTGKATGRIEKLEVDDIRGPDGFGIRRVHGSIELTPVGLTGTAGGPDAAPGAVSQDAAKDDGPSGRTDTDSTFTNLVNSLRPKLSANLTVEGLHTSTDQIQEVGLTGLSGTPELLDDGVRVRDLAVKTITVKGISLDAANGRVTADKDVVISDVSLDVTRQSGGTKADRHGLVHVRNLKIGAITADDLKYTKKDKESSFTLTVKHGALGDIQVPDLTWEQDADNKNFFSGTASAGRVDDVRFDAVSTLFGKVAAKGVAATPDETKSVSGQIVSTPTHADDGTLLPAIGVGFATGEDKTRFDLDLRGLASLGTKYTSPDGSVTVQRTALDVKLRHTGGKDESTEISGALKLTALDLTGVNWHSGKTSITSGGHVRLDYMEVEGRYTENGPDDKGVVTGAGMIRVDKLIAVGLNASDLHYVDQSQDPELNVSLGAEGVPHPGALHADKITLTGFTLPVAADGKLRTDLAAGHLNVFGAHLDGKLVQGALKASGSIDAEKISVGFKQGGRRLTAHATGVGGDLGISGKGWSAQASILKGADSGDITLTPEAISVAGLRIPNMNFAGLTLDSAGPPEVHVKMSERAEVDVKGVAVDAKYEFATKKITLTRMHIDEIDARGLHVDLPTWGVTVDIPVGAEKELAVIKTIDLGGAPGEDGFVIDLAGSQTFLGTLSVDSATVPKMTAHVKDLLQGDVKLGCGKIELGLLQKGNTTVKVSDLAGGTLGYVRYGKSGELIEVKTFGAKTIEHKDGKTTVTGLYAGGMSYVSPGVIFEARMFSAPDPFDFTAKSAMIPRMLVSDGHLIVNFPMLPSSTSGGGLVLKPGPKELGYQIANQLNGKVPLHVLIRRLKVPLYDSRDVYIDVDVNVKDGKLDLDELEAAVHKKIRFVPAADGLSAGAYLMGFSLTGSRLAFGRPDKDIFEWNLPDAVDLTLYHAAAPAHRQLRLSTAIDAFHAVPSDDPVTTTELTLDTSKLDATGPAPISVAISGAMTGHINLSTDVITGITFGGKVVPVAAAGDSAAGSLTGIGVKHIGADELELNFGDGKILKTGSGHIDDIKNGTLTLSGVDALRLELNIGSAEVDGLTWTRP